MALFAQGLLSNQSINQHRFIGEYTNIPLLTQPQQGYDTKYLP